MGYEDRLLDKQDGMQKARMRKVGSRRLSMDLTMSGNDAMDAGFVQLVKSLMSTGVKRNVSIWWCT